MFGLIAKLGGVLGAPIVKSAGKILVGFVVKKAIPKLSPKNKKLDGEMAEFGYKIGLQITTVAKKKVGAPWEFAEAILQEKLEQFMLGLQSGLNSDDNGSFQDKIDELLKGADGP